MKLVVSESAEIPIYRQVYEQISGQILRGELPRDFVLPGIRTIAKELRISVITIKRAWEELERDGFIYTLAGKGCFVAPLHAGELTGKRIRRGVFVSVEDLEKAIKEFLAAWNNEPKPFVWTATVESILEKLSRCRQTLERIKPGCTRARMRKTKGK